MAFYFISIFFPDVVCENISHSHSHPDVRREIDDNFIVVLLGLHYIVGIFYFIAFFMTKQKYRMN